MNQYAHITTLVIAGLLLVCPAASEAQKALGQAADSEIGARKTYTPAEIGQGDFSLKPDKTIVYKTVDQLGEPAELTLHAFFPQRLSNQRPTCGGCVFPWRWLVWGNPGSVLSAEPLSGIAGHGYLFSAVPHHQGLQDYTKGVRD